MRSLDNNDRNDVQGLQIIWHFPAAIRSDSDFSRQKSVQRAADNDKMHIMFFLDIVYWLWQYNSMAFFDADRVLRCVISLEQSCLLFYRFVRFNL